MTSVRIKELPLGERPRERLWHQGPGALSNSELVAILLGTGNAATSQSALTLAQGLLQWARRREAGDAHRRGTTGLRELAAARPDELCQVPGIGPAKAVRVVAAMELGRRLAGEGVRPVRIRRASEVAALLHEEMRHYRKEHLRVVLLSTRRHVLAVETVSIGGLDGTVVHPREVFRPAIQRAASALILVHNHPSGDPTPSPDDLEATRRLLEAGRIVGIEVLDHIILGDRRYVSLRELYESWFA